MKRARDVRDQLVGLMERVELEMETAPEDHDAIKKVIRGC
jgi:pre-mRNA-splicing factor ATP-dependent RNA helicase DHX16